MSSVLSKADITTMRRVARTRPISYGPIPELDALRRRNLLMRTPQLWGGYQYDLSRAGMRALHKAQRSILKRRWGK